MYDIKSSDNFVLRFEQTVKECWNMPALSDYKSTTLTYGELAKEIETLKNEIADLKNTLSNIVSKPAVEPIVEEFEKVKNIEIKGNKAAKLFANLKK